MGRQHGPDAGDRSPTDERSDDSRRPDRGASDAEPDLVVGLGASAGGLQPLTEFLESLADGSGAAYVVVQHLDPDRPSTGPELLQSHTSLPVRRAEDGDPLQAGAVYVTPPDSRVAVEGGVLRLSSPHRESGHPTIVDHFFRSLADDLRERSVAVVLSGTGSDGSLGVIRVREAGGLTMVQDPDSAEFPDMPKNAIGTGHVDVVLPPSDLASYLASYAERHAVSPVPDAQQVDVEEFLDDITRVLKERPSTTKVARPGVGNTHQDHPPSPSGPGPFLRFRSSRAGRPAEVLS